MGGFKNDLQVYRAFDPSRIRPVDDISKQLGWTRQRSYSMKYFISELSIEELDILDSTKSLPSLVIIDAICIQKKEHKSMLFRNLETINASESPFTEIEKLILQYNGIDPLSNIKSQYWIEVGQYLDARHINLFPFNKKAIGFIKSIGFKGYNNLSRSQRDWLIGLLKHDLERGADDRFFVNEHLIQKGYKSECETIEKYNL